MPPRVERVAKSRVLEAERLLRGKFLKTTDLLGGRVRAGIDIYMREPQEIGRQPPREKIAQEATRPNRRQRSNELIVEVIYLDALKIALWVRRRGSEHRATHVIPCRAQCPGEHTCTATA